MLSSSADTKNFSFGEIFKQITALGCFHTEEENSAPSKLLFLKLALFKLASLNTTSLKSLSLRSVHCNCDFDRFAPRIFIYDKFKLLKSKKEWLRIVAAFEDAQFVFESVLEASKTCKSNSYPLLSNFQTI